MSVRHLEHFLKPRSIAFIGGEPGFDRLGAQVARRLLRAGFDGPIMPVHDSRLAIESALTFKSVDALPLAPDLAVLAGAPERLPELIAQLDRRGTRATVSVGATPVGDAGLLRRIAAALREHDVRLVGPQAFGLVVPGRGIDASLATASVPPGDLAFVAQSAGIAAYMMEWAALRQVGFSVVAGLGPMLDVDIGDLLDHLALDSGTRAILLHLDHVSDAREFMSAARVAARIKPVIVVRSSPPGTAGGTSDAVWAAAFRRSGLLAVPRLADLVGAARTLAAGFRVGGDRLAILTNGAGPALLGADVLLEGGGRLAQLSEQTVARLARLMPDHRGAANPLDLGGDADGARYAAALEILLEEKAADAVLVVFTPLAVNDAAGAGQAVAEIAARSRKPVMTAWLGEESVIEARRLFRRRQIASYDSPEAAVTAFLRLGAWQRNRRQLMETPPSAPTLFERDREAATRLAQAALAAGRAHIEGSAAAALLATYGIALRPDGAADAGLPQLRVAVRRDPLFGPVLGIDTLAPPQARRGMPTASLPPLNLSLARRLLEDAGVDRLLGLAPGEDSPSMAGLELMLCKVAQLAAELAELVTLEMAPVVVGSDGPATRGAVLVVERATRPAGDRLAIRPYPAELEQSLVLEDGTALFLRPIRPEDVPMLQATFHRLTPSDVAHRFFTSLKELSEPMAARLTQIDYDREMALLAFDTKSREELMGVVRISADADREQAEFAILVRSDLKGRGLGRRLMERIVAYAGERGIGRIWGHVMADNTPMLSLARMLGFELARDPEDLGVVHATLDLRRRRAQGSSSTSQ
ncbi:GNAT family N-acetyltransferase (plasmid) [Geminicoccaceae bacterium 1502E]|nr:GNAT family N-acetyltransferase [Geminicoccaceae bacterium 1502E]